MHKTIAEAVELVEALNTALIGDPLYSTEACDVAVCPPSIALQAIGDALQSSDSSIGLGGQNMHWEEQGAYTGEISPLMLVGVCEYIIIGHSERRTLFGETDEMVNKKLHAALAHGLKPILCVGENLAQNEAGETEEFVGGQVRAALGGIEADHVMQITIAYEPIWAIGTGVPASGEQANTIIGNAVRKTVAGLYGGDVADAVRIQYGGSTKPHNVAEFLSQPEVDGALVGGASLKASDFAALIHNGIEASS
jgi:triosephosphate isomerase